MNANISEGLKKALEIEKLKNAVLNGAIKITSIPSEQRIKENDFYILACRYARAVSEKRYMEVIQTMQKDIDACDGVSMFLRQLLSDLENGMKYNQFGMIQEEEGACAAEEITIVKKNSSGFTLKISTLKLGIEILDKGFHADIEKEIERLKSNSDNKKRKEKQKIRIWFCLMVSLCGIAWVGSIINAPLIIPLFAGLAGTGVFWRGILYLSKKNPFSADCISEIDAVKLSEIHLEAIKKATKILEIEYTENTFENAKITYADSTGNIIGINEQFHVLENVNKDRIEIDWTNKKIVIPYLEAGFL